MPRLTAIVWLSWKAAFRYRLVWVLTLLLLGAVVGLPLLVRDDGTAAGFSQIVITYTLGAVSVLLGFTTLWLACGTLARDIEESQMQVVAVKPIPRWQIWLGKWLGIVSLNAALLAASGLCIYSLMLWRAGKLPAAEQKKLYEEILVARASLKEPPVDLGPIIEAKWREKLAQGPLAPDVREFVRRQIEEDVKAQVQLVRPGLQRVWKLDASALKGISPSTLLRVRAKFFAADPSAAGRLNPVYNAMWMIGKPGTPSARRAEMRMAAESHQEFSIPAAAIADDGFLYVGFANPNPVALLFPLEDGF